MKREEAQALISGWMYSPNHANIEAYRNALVDLILDVERRTIADAIQYIGKRMRNMLAIAEENKEDVGDLTPVELAETQCFHLMEVRAHLLGEKTCGVYDADAVPTIDGPLFRGAA